MNTAQQLADRFREVMLTGEWVTGTNLKKSLGEISFTQATTKIDSLNTIADLTAHLHYYIEGILRVMKGGKLDISDKRSFDHSPITTDEKWQQLLLRFFTDAESFAVMIEKMSDEQLQSSFADANYGSWEKNINAMIEHGYYHQGQINLLKKLLRNQEKN